ncbi:MAG: AmmeMemoRadiSam system protein A [Nitrospinaceae bacterium]|nr:AmmeMemoRadiSam system protein A [Nitrospinaceae bacterium]NIR57239.1 AmmeMemoRadiSam system protein A [Nitrospinaceae bacterium]NIS87687.1 AmmeMemoRadiSam system protein A [Nitrospinaceae bacterium]NIT84553.1 AmmeMemoRadiSam system protein A [Nitrospinaceae bacterium]NIU46739.1 AmmeMemoRadiSam system protein A [Nitrospinaceae bacterium]
MSAVHHPYISLARQSIHHYLTHEAKLPCPAPLTGDLQAQSGAFVSIKKNSQLRGCIGTLEPCQKNLAEEIIENALKAALHDPRFSPVTRDELPELTLSIDVVRPMEAISDVSELDPKVYGLVVKSSGKQGVLLPDLEGVDSAEEQIRICRKKGSINENDPIELYRFKVDRFH